MIRSVRRFAELDSTNRWAIHHAAEFEDVQLPVLVVAARQTAGRGRLGRSWHADTGTLTFSLLVSLAQLGLERATASRLALVAGLSVAEAIEAFVPPLAARLKWPNDVYVAGGKVGGILVEAAGQRPDRVVIGIGVNVSTDFAAAPAEVRDRARSLAVVANRPLERDALLDVIAERMDENLQQVADGFPGLISAIRQRCLLTGHSVTLQQGPASLRGQCRGIDDSGALVIEDEHTTHRVESGEVVRFYQGPRT